MNNIKKNNNLPYIFNSKTKGSKNYWYQTLVKIINILHNKLNTFHYQLPFLKFGVSYI